MISKVIQNVANRVYFGQKEQHLTPLNTLVDQYGQQVKAFVDRVCGMVVEAELPPSPSHANLGGKCLLDFFVT